MWHNQRIDELADIVSGGTPSREITEYWGGDIAWVTPSDITKCQGNYLSVTEEKITQLGLRNSSAKMLPIGTVLFTSRATIGESRLATKEVCTNQGFKSLISNSGTDSRFLYYSVLLNVSKFKRYAIGSTFPEINKKDMARVEISIPINPEEQQKISNVIESADQAIEKTQAIIAKYENIKKGMMQDLFTRGVDENGQLRPSYEEAPNLYQETELGWIPKGWVIKPASKVCSAVIDCKNRTPPVLDYGHPVIRTPNVRDGRFVYDDLVFTDESSYEIWTARGKPETGDVLITREAPFGETCLIPEMAMKACLGQRMMLYKVNPQKINNQFMCSVIQTSMMQDHLLRLAGGSTVGHIRVGDIRELLIPHPENVNEQEQIASKIVNIEMKLSAEQENLQKLTRIKYGLMQDLLTGKVRVAEDREERKEAVA